MRRRTSVESRRRNGGGARARAEIAGSPKTRMRVLESSVGARGHHIARTRSAPPTPRVTSSPVETRDLYLGALLRVPAQVIHRRIIKGLNAAGFPELRVPHMAVLQFPGPDGVRPGVLAERAGVSKQAMNQLLRSLEGLGYIARSDAPDGGRARIIRFTKRGRAAYSKISEILRDVEREWSAELGPDRFGQLKELLFLVWESPLTSEPGAIGARS